MKTLTLWIAGVVLAGFGLAAQAGPSPQSGVCPDNFGTIASGDTSCNVEIFAGSGGSFSTILNNSNPYDGLPGGTGVEDTLVGFINNSGGTITQIYLTGSNLFGFDGDGIQTFGVAGSDPSEYGGQTSAGQNTSFNVLSSNTGYVIFGSGVANGAWAYFSLEEPPSLNITVSNGVPEPGSLLIFGTGLLGLFFFVKRLRKSDR
ncbi:MAG TPA: PEP-CTERM sorting domain-containing protein [Gammaproteobacteria bacterium]|nr:PEP-CTERM sorting domain-containing protein [Gammaproteobacteria bacterium]